MKVPKHKEMTMHEPCAYFLDCTLPLEPEITDYESDTDDLLVW